MADDQVSRKGKWWTPGFLSLTNLRDVLILLVLGVLFWKLLGCNLAFSVKDFEFSDFLSMFLALFAVSLSVAFYLKATDTSHQFYDNVYKFTRDVSEILGRIEAGFGERLRHIDEGYSGLRDRFENFPFDLSGAKKKAEVEKEEIQKHENEFKAIVSDLMKRAKLAEDEKTRLMQRFETAQEELEFSRRELRHLQHQISEAEIDTSDVDKDFLNYLADRLKDKLPEKYIRAPHHILNKKFASLISQDVISPGATDYMKNHNLLDNNNNLTRRGYHVVSRVFERDISPR